MGVVERLQTARDTVSNQLQFDEAGAHAAPPSRVRCTKSSMSVENHATVREVSRTAAGYRPDLTPAHQLVRPTG